MQIAYLKKVFLLIFYITLLVKIWLAWRLPITGDEAFYYQWGMHPSWHYTEHPPMIGWMMALLLTVSSSLWWIRLPTVLLSSAIAYGLIALLSPFSVKRAYLAASLYLLSPISCLGVLVTTDTPLIAFSFLSILFCIRALRRDMIFDWLASGLFLGLAFLSKYFAVLLGLAYVIYFTLFNKKYFYRFLLICFVALPFIAFNVITDYFHCWYDISFNLINRNKDAKGSPIHMAIYIAMMFYLCTPWLIGYFIKRGNIEKLKRYEAILYLTIWCTATFIFFSLSWYKLIGLHWILSFYMLWFVLCAIVIEKNKLLQSVKFMAGFSILHLVVLLYFSSLPLNNWAHFIKRDNAVFDLYPQDVAQAVAPTDGRILMATGYTPGTVLAYYTGNYVPVFGPGSVTTRLDDIIVDFRAYDGKNIRIFSRGEPNAALYQPYFKQVHISQIQVLGGHYWLIDGDRFNYPSYREHVLKNVFNQYYTLPFWLPVGECGFCQKYGFQQRVTN